MFQSNRGVNLSTSFARFTSRVVVWARVKGRPSSFAPFSASSLHNRREMSLPPLWRREAKISHFPAVSTIEVSVTTKRILLLVSGSVRFILWCLYFIEEMGEGLPDKGCCVAARLATEGDPYLVEVLIFRGGKEDDVQAEGGMFLSAAFGAGEGFGGHRPNSSLVSWIDLMASSMS